MSAPVCMRSVFGACRPRKTTQLPMQRLITGSHSYANVSEPRIKGLPKTSSREEQKNITENLPETAPPKRSIPPSNVSDPAILSPELSLTNEDISEEELKPAKHLPANVIAAYRAPLKHPAPYRVPVASLQLRSFNVRSLEFYSDFALRIAYYLNLPASGPVPLPQRIERWTTLRSNFVNKKRQENFERITYKRLITVLDGEKSVVEVWLALLRKWQFYGVGMKANVWEWEGLDVASKMDAQSKELEKEVEAKLANFGWNKSVAGSRSLDEMFQKQGLDFTGVPSLNLREGSRRSKSEI